MSALPLSRKSAEPPSLPPPIILAGNPNVGKSTLFNYLTGLHQHTGNWTGKTVENAVGLFKKSGQKIPIADLPGIYSLTSHSPEEELARDFLAFEDHRGVMVVCDATCPARGLVLALQVLEMTPRVKVCFNLADQAAKRGLEPDIQAIAKGLSLPVIKTSSKDKVSLRRFTDFLGTPFTSSDFCFSYDPAIEQELEELSQRLSSAPTQLPRRFLAMKLLEQDQSFITAYFQHTGFDLTTVDIDNNRKMLAMQGWDSARIAREFLIQKQKFAAELCRFSSQPSPEKPSLADRLLTGRWTWLPIMLFLLIGVFWLTIYGAGYPSQILQELLFSLERPLASLLTALHLPDWLIELLVYGMYRVVAWVVAVMLPPMAIFFPLFTLMEDIGLLPRIAFDLDHTFQKCRSCGKQSLTMCMGFGCNAAGVVGCRIIRSDRERTIAILTNALVPCNGRFPTLITMLTLFFTVSGGGILSSLISAVELTAVILLGVGMTFLCSSLLSKTMLKGSPSFYSLELPTFRAPKVGQIVVRSVVDRTVFVLLRSVAVAAPAGIVLWLLANTSVGGGTLLSRLAYGLEPVGRLIGLDGAILLAFVLGLPANEIVVPILLMIYTGGVALTDYSSLDQLKLILQQNGWTATTALCMVLFMLFHWPCSTTLLTVYKETKSPLYTLVAFLLPTVAGGVLCGLVAIFL